MSKRGLDALRHALAGDPGPHLDDETLAEIASAEVAGVDIESAYLSQTQHIEVCVACAEAYGDLLSLLTESVAEMTAAARAVPAAAVYASLLQQQLTTADVSLPVPADLAHAVVAALPLFFTSAPLPADVSDDMAAQLLARAAGQEENTAADPALPSALAEALRHTLSALSLYLETVSQSVWGRATAVTRAAAGRWQEIRLSLQPQKQMSLLGGAESGVEWPLFRQQVGQPLPLTVEARARRLSPLACQLHVRVDRPGLRDPSGRPVRLTYFDIELTGETDAKGIARFEPIPIAALPHLIVHIQL